MSEFRHFAKLHDPKQAREALDLVYEKAVPYLYQGKKVEIRMTLETRNGEQNAKFHAMCGDFARSGLEWAGKRRDAAAWKVLLVSGHAMATKEGAEIIPGLEGEFVNIRESTALMSKGRSSSLIEYTMAMGDQMGVGWTNEMVR